MSRQVNVRLDEEEYKRFETASYVEGRSLPEELRAAVRAHIAGLEGNQYFKTALAARMGREREREAERPAVSSLDDKRRRTRRPDA